MTESSDNINRLFVRLERSAFRRRFHLKNADYAYIQSKGIDVVMRHAEDFVRTRLAAAEPRNDGKQTPMRGHPVFTAQHATGTCCRGCLETWHGIARGRPLSGPQQTYVLTVLRRWLEREIERRSP